MSVFGLLAAAIAAFFAGLAWKQARRQADIADRSLKVTQRAFLSIYQVNYTSTIVNKQVDGITGNWIGASFSAKNVGHTAAFDVRLAIARAAIPVGKDIEISDFQLEIKLNGTVLGPDTNLNSSYRFFTDNELLAAYREEIKLFLLTRADYGDVVSEESRHTQVCFYIEFGEDPTSWWVAPIQPNLNIAVADQLTSFS